MAYDPFWAMVANAAGRAGMTATQLGATARQQQAGALPPSAPVGEPPSVWDRLGEIASWSGLALPGRGGFGQAPFSAVMEGGKPKRVYHGTPRVFEEFDPRKVNPEALYGPGFYFTENPEIAGGVLKDASRTVAFPTREAAEAAPGRNYFVWTDPSTGEYLTTVKEQALARRGYAHAIPPEFVVDDPVERLNIVREIDTPSAFWRRPGYLSEAERAEVEKRLRDFEAAPPKGYHPGPMGDLGLLHDMLSGQPYNIDVLKAARRAGVQPNAPNVRPAFLDITKPFDIDAPVAPTELRNIANLVQKRLGAKEGGQKSMLFGLRDLIEGADLGATPPGDEVYSEVARMLGSRAEANKILQMAGYDGITHIGGKVTGSDPHRVWIGFKPGQIYSSFTPPEQLP